MDKQTGEYGKAVRVLNDHGQTSARQMAVDGSAGGVESSARMPNESGEEHLEKAISAFLLLVDKTVASVARNPA